MIGLEKGIVKLTLYSAEWKLLFETEKASLLTVLGNYILEIQHVGSTSIPGMLAGKKDNLSSLMSAVVYNRLKN